MKLRIASDIHSEFFGADEIAEFANTQILPPLPDDKETTLLLAGDIGAASNPECLLNFLEAVCPRFKAVFKIPGNHGYYRGNIQTTPQKIRDMVAHIPNLYFTTAGSVALGPNGETLHMHTLWTDFDKENPLSMVEAMEHMNDYRLIRNGDRLLLPQDTLGFHKQHLSVLERGIKEGDVVMTHHSPSLRSIPVEYLNNRMNGAYHSDLDDLILRKKPKLWVHGHTHTATTYMLGDTQVVCNPHGYGNQYKKNGYNPELVVEV